jgi:glycosyltransferase involved in cell wall biosynthesis
MVLVRADGPNLAGLASEIRVVDLGCDRVIASVRRLAAYIDVAKPAALLSTLTYANLPAVWATGLARHKPCLVLREANTLSVASSGSAQVRERLLPWLSRFFYPLADGVVAVSSGVAQDLVDNVGIPRSMVRVIHNPTYGRELASLMRESVDHPWIGDGGSPVLLSVGRLNTQKRFDVLIRAAALVRTKRPIRVLILGEGEDRAKLESLVRELALGDCVSMPGYCDNPYAYMAKARLYVMASAWEGFPNALVEAMACGLPVVSTDCPSGPRDILMGDDGEALGRIVPVDDANALANAILSELDTARDTGTLRLRAQMFTTERAVGSYLDLLRALSVESAR